ncbi:MULTISPECIES: hypothetical protein [Halorussus]|uniref:hypothetical protein n=1 Tax=Halorussus TaxID=1070314 RepID=UPI0020A16E5B|nr:hypothetical protein [Halorussus vallis]USZ74591.1 hypothetical protein NGM07_14210 [Halorussus vallis]
MYELLLELGGEAFLVVGYAVGTLALSAVGAFAEYEGLQQFMTGDQTLAAWYAYVGLVALALAFQLGRKRLAPQVAGR